MTQSFHSCPECEAAKKNFIKNRNNEKIYYDKE